MKPTLSLILCLALFLPAAAQARDRQGRGGCFVVIDVVATPFVWLGGLFRPTYSAPIHYAPTYYAPVRRGYVSDTDYMLYGSGRGHPRYR